MVSVVAAPGSCGEFIQGYCDGASFMVTCPVDRYSRAEAWIGAKEPALPEKARIARERTLAYLGQEAAPVSVHLSSEIPVGKGMASSTADISAVCQATALVCGRRLSREEIGRIAISIEPSDATFYEGIVQFDYRRGVLLRRLGCCPPAKILVYDCGGEVDTLAFNARSHLIDRQKENEPAIRKAMTLFLEGIRSASVDRIGEAATMSAFANQTLLYKEALPSFYEAAKAAGGRGVIAAHSGTVLGLLLAESDDAEAVRAVMDRELRGAVSFLDLVHVTNQGMQVEMKR